MVISQSVLIHFSIKKTLLSRCFIFSILPDNYDTSRSCFKILCDKKSYFFLDAVFIKCLKFSFANWRSFFWKEN